MPSSTTTPLSERPSAIARIEQPVSPAAQYHTPIVLAALIGLVLSLIAAFLAWEWEERIAQHEFEAVAQNHFRVLQKGLDEYLNELQALRAFYESSDFVSRNEFEAFAGRLLSGQKGIQNFSWAPLVTRNERKAHEHAAAESGIPDYQIKAVTDEDLIVISPEKDEYLPILYSTLPRGSRVYGIDLLSQPVIAQRLEHARAVDRLSSVPDFLLHSQDIDTHGFLFSLPVYRHGEAQSEENRWRDLAGFVHGAFLTSEAVEQILLTVPKVGLDISLFLADGPPDAAPLHVHGSRLRKEAAEPLPRSILVRGRNAIGTLSAGDTHWTLIATPMPDGPMILHHERAWLVLLAGLLVSAIAALYMRSGLQHAQRLLQANLEISSLARRDSLTGLFNRRAFNEYLATAFAGYRRASRPFALLYFDLDHFKDVNDTLGHPIGDRLLQRVAVRVQSAVRTGDVVARFGGDEFAVLQMDADESSAIQLASRINELLARPFEIDSNDVHVSASIGIAKCTQTTTTPEALVMQADLALYRAKGDGRNCFRFHSSEFDREVHERVWIADGLRSALGRREMCLHYQPQVALKTGRIIGVEALLRWHHPERGLLDPSKFVPVAERTGNIVALGEWVIDEACRQTREWSDLGLSPGVTAVNVSASQFKAGSGVADFIATSLRKWDIAPPMLEVELTESVLMEVTQDQNNSLDLLRDFKVRIAIDDFGTGYSSLSYLTNYPVNRLKIAQELVFGVTTDRRNATVVRAAIRLAAELGIECIAEGVESAEQAAFLIESGCAYAQGFYFSKPLDAKQMTALLRKQNACLGQPSQPQLKLVAG